MALADISTESTSRGGTNVGDAIRKAAREVFDSQGRQFKDIILITDGEEPEGNKSFPIQAAESAGNEGVRIISIGLGDDDAGSRIPITAADGSKTFLKYKGQEVWSKLDSATLKQIAAASKGGRYLAVRPGETLDLGKIYLDLIASAEKSELEAVTMISYDEKFQIFVAFAIILIIWESFLSECRKQNN
jgi:Ca-activated chloride channel family protein